MDTMSNEQSDALMAEVNRLPILTKQIIKKIAALASKINNHPNLETYIRPLLVLLSNTINIKGDAILQELKPRFEQLLVGYVFYMEQILLDTIDLSAYEEKNDMLVHVNHIVKRCVQNQNASEFYSSII
jgi:hypothetical protein